MKIIKSPIEEKKRILEKYSFNRAVKYYENHKELIEKLIDIVYEIQTTNRISKEHTAIFEKALSSKWSKLGYDFSGYYIAQFTKKYITAKYILMRAIEGQLEARINVARCLQTDMLPELYSRILRKSIQDRSERVVITALEAYLMSGFSEWNSIIEVELKKRIFSDRRRTEIAILKGLIIDGYYGEISLNQVIMHIKKEEHVIIIPYSLDKYKERGLINILAEHGITI